MFFIWVLLWYILYHALNEEGDKYLCYYILGLNSFPALGNIIGYYVTIAHINWCSVILLNKLTTFMLSSCFFCLAPNIDWAFYADQIMAISIYLGVNNILIILVENKSM